MIDASLIPLGSFSEMCFVKLNCLLPSCALGAKESSKLHVFEQKERNLAHKNKCELYLKISLGDQCGCSSFFFVRTSLCGASSLNTRERLSCVG